MAVKSSSDLGNLTIREIPLKDDPEKVSAIVKATGFFSESEVEIATELVKERLSKDIQSGYYFVFAEENNELIGYTCYGPVAGTQSSFDLYWIVIAKGFQGCGIGKFLNKMTENIIREMGGTRIYAETSSRAQYEPTRAFYHKAGYIEDAYLVDFYAPDDGKIIFVKKTG
ncbi:MAG: GNAT family N-acetyltransferase [Proteobacteria bacterium]|nr:GNAT family N-acetyltransferase [Pseudomonadota bacterium]